MFMEPGANVNLSTVIQLVLLIDHESCGQGLVPDIRATMVQDAAITSRRCSKIKKNYPIRRHVISHRQNHCAYRYAISAINVKMSTSNTITALLTYVSWVQFSN